MRRALEPVSLMNELILSSGKMISIRRAAEER